jgi:hypothetical protein
MKAIITTIIMAMIIAMATGCGYSKQCTTSPLQEYNHYKE